MDWNSYVKARDNAISKRPQLCAFKLLIPQDHHRGLERFQRQFPHSRNFLYMVRVIWNSPVGCKGSRIFPDASLLLLFRILCLFWKRQLSFTFFLSFQNLSNLQEFPGAHCLQYVILQVNGKTFKFVPYFQGKHGGCHYYHLGVSMQQNRTLFIIYPLFWVSGQQADVVVQTELHITWVPAACWCIWHQPNGQSHIQKQGFTPNLLLSSNKIMLALVFQTACFREPFRYVAVGKS